MTIDNYWMQQALLQAEKAALCGEVPVGAVLIGPDGLLSAAGNNPIGRHDPTAHAEIIAIRSAAEQLHNYRLPGTTLYVTLEPCVMCMGALILARIERLVYGAADPKTGAVNSLYSIGRDGLLNHKIDIVGGVLAEQCGALLKNFFQARRKEKTK
ncbi:tRNA adenosine(34) deaminase TadA [Desulfopila sp. IMCC35006]|uniref:tRNA adenosine(34) deaminase TadA n=1 Tax=Desulfopila sp. IMCC35006 TaxID=2569542 RepID=UPI0010AC6354|nr:tRNA adenosine(34) deaminase TadA [Desulfopila sp. IMCC35006]TKB23658.1 tRNA adenosine(34) deaminase TadA [Desulfopila sp. IMCC35006]